MAEQQYIKITEQDMQDVFHSANEQVAMYSGAGSFYSQYSTFMSAFDRFGYKILPIHTENSGYTFITRPKLNLTTTSLRQDPILSMLDTLEPRSLQFAIRCYLDTNFAAKHIGRGQGLAARSPFFNHESPFIVPLSNSIEELSGAPDPVLDVKTTSPGIYGEDLTYAKGSDRLARTYDITINFRRVQGDINTAIIWMWQRFMELVTRGDVMAYNEDIYRRRLCYTCSIYRFTLDTTKQYIQSWAKFTGCFPKTISLGEKFNQTSTSQVNVESSALSTVFTVNKAEYMDPRILLDFNRIVERFAGNDLTTKQILPVAARYNFAGIPYIRCGNDGFNRFVFLGNVDDFVDPLPTTVETILNRQREIAEEAQREVLLEENNPDPLYGRDGTY